MKLKKLSKSDAGPKFFHKAQVFKWGQFWIASCQEGCGGIKWVPRASQELMFKIADGHMRKVHIDKDENGKNTAKYIKSHINGR